MYIFKFIIIHFQISAYILLCFALARCVMKGPLGMQIDQREIGVHNHVLRVKLRVLRFDLHDRLYYAVIKCSLGLSVENCHKML